MKKVLKLFLTMMAFCSASSAVASLRITEICPRPDEMDPNGKEAGWIELQNTGEADIDLSAYRLIRFNRGKEDKKKNRKAFPSITLKGGERILVYTGDEYPNADEGEGEEIKVYSVWKDGVETEDKIIVFPFKVNPKKYPTVRLYRGESEIIETFFIPVDLEDNKSFAPLASADIEKKLVDETTPYSYRVQGEETWSSAGAGPLTGLLEVPPEDVAGRLEISPAADDPSLVATALTDRTGFTLAAAWNLSGDTEKLTGVKLPKTVTADLVDSGVYTVAFWFRSTDSGNVPLFDARPSGTGSSSFSGAILVLDADRQVQVQFRNSDKSNSASHRTESDVENGYADGAWHHVVLTAGQTAGSPVRLTVDGEVAADTELTIEAPLQADKPLCFGHALDSSYWNAFTGSIADIRLYPRELSVAEARAVMAESAPLREVTGSLTVTEKTVTQDASGVMTFSDSAAATEAYAEADIDSALVGCGETVDLWVNPRAWTSTHSDGTRPIVLVDARQSSAAGYMVFVTESGELCLQRGVGGSESFEETATGVMLPEDCWSHLTLVWSRDDKTATLFVNGVRKESFVLENDYSAPTASHRFCGSRDSYWSAYRGTLAHPRVYSGVLSDLEVAKLHNQHAESFGVNLIRDAGLAGVEGTALFFEEKLAPIEAQVTLDLEMATTLYPEAVDCTGKLSLTWNGADVTPGNPITAGAGKHVLGWTLSPESDDDTRIAAALRLVSRHGATGTLRAILPNLTPGRENDLTDSVFYGPNVGPAPGSEDEGNGVRATMPAPLGAAYPITYELHPLSDDPANAITAVTLRYEVLTDRVVASGEIEMELAGKTTWSATVPAEALQTPGSLLRHKAVITDMNGMTWLSPSENNPDDCPLWFGTLVDPGESSELQTFHLFTDADTDALVYMDKQFDDYATTRPYGARVGIYDAKTDTYYDNVRIDLRGNTSAGFKKKSHGLRFNKCQPLIFKHPFDPNAGDKGEIETRKTSFTAEYPDPTYLRQSLSFYIWRNAGNLVPFHYPVRLMLNGEFYQLAFHTNRFTDELIEDYYGLDPKGYGYKNVGTFSPTLWTSAGGIEKKTPDDGIETGTVAMEPLQEFVNQFKSVNASTEDDEDITKVVVQHFDLPAWFNYLATARITQEADDVWANISAYYDVNGTNTWMPLAYDHNLSFGQWYYNDDRDAGKIGLRPDDDSFKSHPFYGGHRIRAHRKDGSMVANPNYAVEAVWQSSKFRRLYLRRLRTLMDEILKEPDTTADNTPFWSYMTTMQAKMKADAAIDRDKWGYGDDTQIYVWDKTMTLEEGIEDMWDNYVFPRRVHLFETHSVTNTTKEIGYGAKLNAGIPEPQSAIADLKAGITLKTKLAELDDVLVIQNTNDEAVDMSNWTLAGAVEWTLPPGTVIDAQIIDGVPGELYIVKDRNAYVLAHETELTDQVIVGNAEFTESQVFTLTATDGTEVIATEPSDAMLGLRVAEVMPATPEEGGDGAEYIILKNILTDKVINLEGVKVRAMKDEDGKPWKVDITLPAETLEPGATCRLDKADFEKSGWVNITNGKVRFEIRDAEGALCQYAYWSDEWYPQTDGGGASLIAVSFESEIGTGGDGKLDWKPSFVWPTNEAAQTAITEAILANGAIATWLRTLNEAGNEALASFTGSAADLELCWLINLPPVEKPAVEMTITEIAFDADGNVQIDGGLTVGKTEHTASVNGSIKVLKYTALGAEPDVKELTIKTFPLEVSIAPEEARFFKLKVE